MQCLQDSFRMDIVERPYFATFPNASSRNCRMLPTLAALRACLGTGEQRLDSDAHVGSEASVPYRGMSLEVLSETSEMVATAHSESGSSAVALLALQVPGVLESRPAVVFGSRVHIAYEVRCYTPAGSFVKM
jgi:hypothetical protein